MLSNIETRRIIGWVLTIGTLFSAGLVLIGGVLSLIQHGGDHATNELTHPSAIYTSITAIWQSAMQGLPLGIIALGVICLVLTQALRVGLLIAYYLSIRDYFFTLVCLFVFAH